MIIHLLQGRDIEQLHYSTIRQRMLKTAIGLALIGAVLIAVLVFTGCKTTGTIETPEQLRSDVGSGAQIGLDVYPAAAPEVKIARDVICAQVGKTNVNPTAIVADLQKAGITNSNSKLIVDGAVFLYNRIFNQIGGDIPNNYPVAQSYLNATCLGLTDALPPEGPTTPMAKKASLPPHLK